MTDTMGNLLAITVHAANIHDTIGGVEIYDKAKEAYPSIERISGEMGCRGTFANHIAATNRKCEITERIKPKEWIISPKRWVVERTFAWVTHSRRLSKDFEIRDSSDAAWFSISHCFSLLRTSSYTNPR